MDLYPQRMGLDGGETGKITFEDETGTTIESNGGLVPVSYTHLEDGNGESMLLPSVIGVLAVEEEDYKLLFGYDAIRLANASYRCV